MRDLVVILSTAFRCMIEVIVSLLAVFICTYMTNAWFILSLMLWKLLGYTASLPVVCITLTVPAFHKPRIRTQHYYLWQQ